MLEHRLADTLEFGATVENADGAVAADSTPTYTVFQNNTAVLSDQNFTATAVTGLYRAAVALTTGAGFAVGDTIRIVGKAIVGGKTHITDLYEGRIVAARAEQAYADTQTLVGRLTSARAGYFDKLNITGSVAGSAEVTAVLEKMLHAATGVIAGATGSPELSYQLTLTPSSADPNGCTLLMKSGAAAGVRRTVIAWNSGTTTATLDSEITLANSDTFVLIPSLSIGGRGVAANSLLTDVYAMIGDYVWTDGVGDHADPSTFGGLLNAIADLIAALPNAAENADAVCDEALSGHATAGTVGAALTSAAAAISMPDVDGVPFEVTMAAILALLTGKKSVSDNVLTCKRRDGSTTILTVTFGPVAGQVTESVIVGE